MGWKIRPCRGRLKDPGDRYLLGYDPLIEKAVVPLGFVQVSEEMRSLFPITRLLIGRGWTARLFFVTGLAHAVRWSLCTSNLVKVGAGLLCHGRGCFLHNQQLAKAGSSYHPPSHHTVLHLGPSSA